MSQVTVYEYTATANGTGVYNVSYNPDVPVSVTDESLSQGDSFVVAGKIYQYLGAADVTLNGTAVGFFAAAPNGSVHFFATSPLPGNETLYLNTSQSYVTCFMAQTRIATPTGAVNVESLAIGDVVSTTDGGQAPVKWVGRQTVVTLFADPTRVLPIRIKAGALGENLPTRDLRLSPCHAVFLDGVLVQAGALVNGTSIVRDTEVPASFVYYHVELENHALILADGVAAETFIDNVDRMAFDNWDEHQRLYPGAATVPELPHARAASSRQVPAALARRLAARAEAFSIRARDAA